MLLRPSTKTLRTLLVPSLAGTLIAIASATVAIPLAAQGIAVGPVRIDMPADRPSASLEVRSGDFVSGTLVQITAFVWTEDGGERVLEPTDELMATPSVFRLDPGAVRTVVLQSEGARSAPRYYRVRVAEVPDEAGNKEGAGITLLRAFDLPVFVQEAGAAPAVVAEAEMDVAEGQAHVRVSNAGNGYALGATVRVVIGETTVAGASGQYYLLPGSTRDITVPLPEQGSSAPMDVAGSSVRFIVEDGDGAVLAEGVVGGGVAASGSSR